MRTGTMVRTGQEVQAALGEGRPVVALETAVLTHGLPRTPLGRPVPVGTVDSVDEAGFDPSAPCHLELIRAMGRAVRHAGAVPAVVGVLDGTLHVGLEDAAIERLAHDATASKASTRELAAVLHGGGSAGTTVAATLTACSLARPAPIRVFATGGIGGVHRGYSVRPDVSADLLQLARHEVCVVCAGAKSILDLPATLEALETLGVGVVGYRTAALARFTAPLDPALPVPHRVDSADEVAGLCRTRWEALQLPGAVLLSHPLPDESAVPDEVLAAATTSAEEAADAAGVIGPERTPYLLQAIAERTQGRSLDANLLLLMRNASLAGTVAAALADHPERS